MVTMKYLIILQTEDRICFKTSLYFQISFTSCFQGAIKVMISVIISIIHDWLID